MEKLLAFLEFKKNTKTVVFRGFKMYDVFGHYKYLSELELSDYFFNIIQQKTDVK